MSDDPAPSSIWTRPIELPPRLRPAARASRRVFKMLGVVLAVLVVIAWVPALYNAWTFRSGARLTLAQDVYVRVPSRFSGMTLHDDDPGALQMYYFSPVGIDSSSNHISVEALTPGSQLGFRDPARMAAYARESGDDVQGPVHFTHAGFEVTATVEPTICKGRLEGAHTLYALVDVHGQLVYISGDSVTLGVPDDASPQTMARAAIDVVRLSVDE